MIEYESSLRLPVLGVVAALVALVLAGSAQAAGGSPVPVPDDPPPGIALTRKKVVQPVTTPVTAPRATKKDAVMPATEATASVPTPDPPVVQTRAKQAEPQASGAAVADRGGTATVTNRVIGRSSPRVVAPKLAAPVVATTVTARRATTQPMVVTRSETPAERKRPSPQPKKPKSLAARAAEVSEPVARLPHDALRLGLPVGALIVGRPGSEPDAGLLALAALLLGVAACGTLVVVFAARGVVRQA